MGNPPNALTKGSVLKALVTFTVPFLLANVLQSLYGAVDLFVVGQFCDAQAVAAVSTGTQVTQIVTSLVTWGAPFSWATTPAWSGGTR